MRAHRYPIFTLFVLLVFGSGAWAGESFSKSLCGIHYPSDEGIAWDCVTVKRGATPEKAFGKYWEDVLRFNRLDRRHFVAGRSIKVPKNLEQVRGFNPLPLQYPDAAQEPKFILVDQSEMFLGAYEYGTLVFSMPAAVGMDRHRVPNGQFRIDALDRGHESDTYRLEGTDDFYPMNYGMRFLVDNLYWISYWIHGRDLPGYPASHGCIGLYDEEMQERIYRNPKEPVLTDAKRLYEWVIGNNEESGSFQKIDYGPRVVVIGTPPV